jgi:hypothetical protein
VPAPSARIVALALVVLAVGLGGLGLLRGAQGLENLDGVACPAVLGEDRLVTVLTGKDPECDATRAAQRATVLWLLGSSAGALIGATGVWSLARRRS